MKKIIKATLALVSCVIGVSSAYAQNYGAPNGDGANGGGPPRHHRPPPLPLMLALDANHDGIIDSNEIANASAELLTLDKNGDGQLTADEYLPPRPRNADSQTFRPPPSPLIEALDANHDGIIDANEIANAPAELKALDKNGDGTLTRDEFCPPPPRDQDNGDSAGPQGPPPDDAPNGGPPPSR